MPDFVLHRYVCTFFYCLFPSFLNLLPLIILPVSHFFFLFYFLTSSKSDNV